MDLPSGLVARLHQQYTVVVAVVQDGTAAQWSEVAPLGRLAAAWALPDSEVRGSSSVGAAHQSIKRHMRMVNEKSAYAVAAVVEAQLLLAEAEKDAASGTVSACNQDSASRLPAADAKNDNSPDCATC